MHLLTQTAESRFESPNPLTHGELDVIDTVDEARPHPQLERAYLERGAVDLVNELPTFVDSQAQRVVLDVSGLRR
jgi:hypothetical protein